MVPNNNNYNGTQEIIIMVLNNNHNYNGTQQWLLIIKYKAPWHLAKFELLWFASRMD